MSEENVFDTWGIVELFGHARIAGKISEQVIAGNGFIRVDVPLLPANKFYPEQPAFTRLFGPSAIYSITPVSNDLAIAAAESMRVKPVNVYVAVPQLMASDQDEDDFDPEDDDSGDPDRPW